MFDEEAFDMRFLSQHNSFVIMYFRLGVIGGTIFFLMFVRHLFRRERPGRQWSARWLALFLAFVATFVNPGVESPQFMVGICLTLAFATAATRPYSWFAHRRALDAGG